MNYVKLFDFYSHLRTLKHFFICKLYAITAASTINNSFRFIIHPPDDMFAEKEKACLQPKTRPANVSPIVVTHLPKYTENRDTKCLIVPYVLNFKMCDGYSISQAGEFCKNHADI